MGLVDDGEIPVVAGAANETISMLECINKSDDKPGHKPFTYWHNDEWRSREVCCVAPILYVRVALFRSAPKQFVKSFTLFFGETYDERRA